MCFSPQADVVGGLVVGAIGVDALRHVKDRPGHLALASLPLLLGFHQLDESFIWLSLQHHIPMAIGRVALYIYAAIAFVVLPLYVPIAVLAIEPAGARRWRMLPFVALGAAVAVVLAVAVIDGPLGVRLATHHLAYSLHIHDGLLVVGSYVAAICGALLFSGYRHVLFFGLINLVAVAILAKLTIDGFASLWCAYAAVTSGAIAAHMRFARPHRALPYVVT